jgi:nitrous oxidase accessory protein NosD
MSLKKLSRSAVLLTCALSAAAVHAQASYTWVSGTGSDSNPCSRTSPCKTFAGAIPGTASKGRINALDSGAFGTGTLTISKSITIDSSDSFAGVLVAGTNGIVISAATTDVVTLRGLTIDGNGTGLDGIQILSAKEVHIENCTIQGFVNRGILANNSSGSVNVYIRNTVIRNNTGASSPGGNSGAVLLRPTGTGIASAIIESSHLDQNTFGLRVEANSRATMSDSTASGNATFGVHATSTTTSASIILERVVITNNATGVQAEGSPFASVRFSDLLATSNSVGLSSVAGGQLLSWTNNRVAGNGTNGAPTSTTPQI